MKTILSITFFAAIFGFVYAAGANFLTGIAIGIVKVLLLPSTVLGVPFAVGLACLVLISAIVNTMLVRGD